MSRDDDLVTGRQVVFAVRLLVDAEGQLVHGELVDLNEHPRGRFDRWDGLTAAIQECLREEVTPRAGLNRGVN
jgi:hypothetical protein